MFVENIQLKAYSIYMTVTRNETAAQKALF